MHEVSVKSGTVASEAFGLVRCNAESFQPIAGFVLIERYEPEEKWGSLVVLAPDADKQRKSIGVGVVVAIGDGEVSEKSGKRLPMETRIGDVVLLDSYAGHDLQFSEHSGLFTLVTEANILGVVESGLDELRESLVRN